MHPDVCNWISSETISSIKGKRLFPWPKGLCILCWLWPSFKFRSIKIPGAFSGKWWERTQHYQKGSRRGTNPSALGGAAGEWYIAEKSSNQKPGLCMFVYPSLYGRLSQWHIDYKIQADCTLETLACHHSTWAASHKCFESQHSPTEPSEVSKSTLMLSTRGFLFPKGNGARHKWQVSYIPSWWKRVQHLWFLIVPHHGLPQVKICYSA